MMSLHVIFGVASVCLFFADVSALRGAATPDTHIRHVVGSNNHVVDLSLIESLFAGAFFLLLLGTTLVIITRTLRSLPWVLTSWLPKIINREIASWIDPTKSEHIASILDPWLSKIIDREIASRIAQASPAAAGNQGGSLTASDGILRPRKESSRSPLGMLASAYEQQKLKDQYDELSTKVGFYNERLGKKVTALETWIQNLTKQGITREERCEKSLTKYLERTKTLELQAAEHHSCMAKERLRSDSLVSTTKELEAELIAIGNVEKGASHSAEPSTQPTKVEPADVQLEKRVGELKQSQLVAAKRLDALELRSRLNASIVDQLKENLGPGYRAMDANLTASQNRMMNALHQQRDKLQALILEQRSYINAEISALQKPTGDAPEDAGQRTSGQSADSNACAKQVTDVESHGNTPADASTLPLEKYTAKLKEIVAASKKKFDEHAARLLGLEAAVFKPAQNALPTEDRLDNLEYDVQKLKDEGNGETPDLREIIEQVNTVQEDISRLRIDVRTALNKAITKESHRRSLEMHEEFKQQATSRLEAMEREKADGSRQVQEFEKRLQRMRHDCDGLVAAARQLVESEAGRLSNLEAVLMEANESFSFGLVQIRQQLDLLEPGIKSLSKGKLKWIKDHQSTTASKELISDLSFISESNYSDVAVHGHPEQVDHRTPVTSARKPLSTALTESGVIDSRDSSAQHPLDTAASGNSYQSVNVPGRGRSNAENHVNRHDPRSLDLPVASQSEAFTSTFDSQRERPSGHIPDYRIAALAERINTVEQKLSGLVRCMQNSSLANTDAPDMAIRPKRDLQEAAGLSLLHTGSGQELQQREEDPVTCVPTSGIWQLSGEDGYLSAVQTELRQFQAEVDKRLSHLERGAAMVADSTFQGSPCAKSSAPSSQYPALLSPVGSPTLAPPNPQSATASSLAVPGSAMEWQAIVPELHAKLEQVHRDLLKFETSRDGDSAALATFKREIQNKWSRQLGSLPRAAMVNELATNYQALAARVNSLEYNLRYRRVTETARRR